MFWKRDHRPPLSARQRVDLELLLRRTVKMVGLKRVQNADWVMDLNALEFNLTDASSALDSINQTLLRLLPECPPSPKVEVVSSESIDGLSTYESSAPTEAADESVKNANQCAIIKLSDELYTDPLRLVMELASQHSLHFWHQITPQHPLDLTPLTTHLLPLCCGLGYLASDASLYDSQWSLVGYSGWTLSRSGYYTAQEIGYALATLSRLKIDLPPKWHDRLRPDSRDVAKQVLQHQESNGNRATLFDANEIPSSKCTSQQLAEWLEGDRPDFSLASMEALLLQNRPLDRFLSRAIDLTNNKDPSIVHAATKLLGKISSPNEAGRNRIHELIKHRDAAIAIEAVHSAIEIGVPLDAHAKRVGKLIERLGPYGQDLLRSISESPIKIPDLIPVLCRQLDESARSQNSQQWAHLLITCLRSQTPTPNQAIERYCHNAVAIIEEFGEVNP